MHRRTSTECDDIRLLFDNVSHFANTPHELLHKKVTQTQWLAMQEVTNKTKYYKPTYYVIHVASINVSNNKRTGSTNTVQIYLG